MGMLKDALQAGRDAAKESRAKDAAKADAKHTRKALSDGTYLHTKARGEAEVRRLLASGWEVEVAAPMLANGGGHSVGTTLLRKKTLQSA